MFSKRPFKCYVIIGKKACYCLQTRVPEYGKGRLGAAVGLEPLCNRDALTYRRISADF